jgi:hypothetical protein
MSQRRRLFPVGGVAGWLISDIVSRVTPADATGDPPSARPGFEGWLAALEARHLADLQFSEVTRALRALSSTYVERRERLAKKSAFDSAGKRAAYALYYSPLHYLTVAHIVRAIGLHDRPLTQLVDAGCGAGAAGAAWASSCAAPPSVVALDVHPWSIAEAAFTYRQFGLQADAHRGDLARLAIPRAADAIVLGWVLNEIDARTRAEVGRTLAKAASRGAHVLVVEPIARKVAPWWSDWVRDLGVPAKVDEWRFAIELPPLLAKLDRAAGMRHEQLTARSVVLGGDSAIGG